MTRPLVGYVRVSTSAQARDGLGLDVQEGQVRAWAMDNSHKIADILRDEGVSGTLPAHERPGLTDALAMVQDRTACGLVVARLDRLARTLTVQEAVLSRVWTHGGAVFSADVGEVLADDPDDPMRTALRQMQGVLAQLDRAMIAKRLRDGRRAKVERGGFGGGTPPYGLKTERGVVVPDDREQAALTLVTELRAQGASLRQIGQALTDAGHRPKRSDHWHPNTVRKIVSRLD
jgi:DNA invertase Pin-like site-specific DNA recombinase